MTFKSTSSQICATFFGVGFSPYMPGTVASLVSLILWWPLLLTHLTWLYLGCIVLLTLMGLVTTSVYLIQTTHKDPHEVVIDEVLGCGVALIGVPPQWIWVISAFLLFRLFDIWKPGPIGWVDKNVKGSVGVILDDLMAGLIACLIVQGFIAFFV